MANSSIATLFFFSTVTLCCSGTLAGSSYDAKSKNSLSSLRETVSFLRKNHVSLSQIRSFVSDLEVLESLYSSVLSLDLYAPGNKTENLQKSKSSAISWIKPRIFNLLPCFNITGITVSRKSELPLLLPASDSIHNALTGFKLEDNLLSFNRISQTKLLHQIVVFIGKSMFSIVIEIEITGELSLGDLVAPSMIEAASSATTVSWIKTRIFNLPRCFNITSITVSGKSELPLLLPTLNPIHNALIGLIIEPKLKLSAAFSLSLLENQLSANRVSQKNRVKHLLHQIVDFIRKSNYSFAIEAEITRELSLRDRFVQSMIEAASSATTVSWIKTRIFNRLPCFNITRITVSSMSELSSKFSLSFLENQLSVNRVSQKNHVKHLLHQIIDFIRKSKSSFVIETEIIGELSLEDRFVRIMIEAASSAATVSWIKTRIFNCLPFFNITSITVSSKNELPLILPTLNSIHNVLISLKHEHKLKLSTAFSLSFLENQLSANRVSQKNHVKHLLHQIVDFIRKSESSFVIETEITIELSLGDRFVRLMIEAASSITTVLPHNDLPLILNFKSSAVPGATEILEFTEKLLKLVNLIQIKSRISGFFPEFSPLGEFEKKELDREEQQIFPSSHRELFNKNNQPFFPTKTTQHDLLTTHPPTTVTVYPSTDPVTIPTTPITNPVTTPITIPATNPVTTPVANPTPSPTNPATTPVTNPVTTPITAPNINPVPTPATTPITTPVTSPITTPVMSPITIASPTVQPPALPATTPVTGHGQQQNPPIQQNGICYNPNTLCDCASYAFNCYYQKNPVQSSCEIWGKCYDCEHQSKFGKLNLPNICKLQ